MMKPEIGEFVMCKICPKCGAIAEYNAYYSRTTCTSCSWESAKARGTKTVVRKVFCTTKGVDGRKKLVKA